MTSPCAYDDLMRHPGVPTRPIMLLAGLVLTCSLAGCVTSDDPSDRHASAASTAALDTARTNTTWTGCDQWHLHFDARAEDLQPDVPPGFTVRDDGAGLTTFLIHVTLCPDAQEALLAVHVDVPTEHEDPERDEIAVLQVFHDGHGPVLYPAPFADRLVNATFSHETTPLGPRLTVEGGNERFTMTNVLAPSSGDFREERWARFGHDGTTIGVVTADGAPSTNVGFGPVTYTHEGPGGAPPATAGNAHHVTGLDITFQQETRT